MENTGTFQLPLALKVHCLQLFCDPGIPNKDCKELFGGLHVYINIPLKVQVTQNSKSHGFGGLGHTAPKKTREKRRGNCTPDDSPTFPPVEVAS